MAPGKGINTGLIIERAKEVAAEKGLRGRRFKRFVERRLKSELWKAGIRVKNVGIKWDDEKGQKKENPYSVRIERDE